MHILGEILIEIFTAADKIIEANSCRNLPHFVEDIFWNEHSYEYFTLRRTTGERGSNLHQDGNLRSLRIFSLPCLHVVIGTEVYTD